MRYLLNEETKIRLSTFFHNEHKSLKVEIGFLSKNLIKLF